jgi:hypothetical protein
MALPLLPDCIVFADCNDGDDHDRISDKL